MKLFQDFRKVYMEAGFSLPYRRYKQMLVIIPIVTLVVCFGTTYFIINYFHISYYIIFFPIFAVTCAAILLFVYPYDRKKVRKNSINLNLPYALSYMASIAETGVSPVAMFESIARFDVYEEVSKEAASIVKQIQILGKDLLSVLQSHADRTPSEDFREVLKGLLSVLHAGGNVSSYLRQHYNDIMFRKILKEQEYEKSLAIYENVFTILLVVLPLLVFIFLMLGEIISPGMVNAVFILKLLVYIFLPIGNVIFIMALKVFRGD